jgi:hypothetical protein
MASCGGRTQAWQRGSRNNSSLNDTNWTTRRWWSTCAVAGLAAVIFLAGCMSVKYGSPPRTDRLGTLTVGVSSSTDVLSALGEPRGRGAARFSIDQARRTIWSYEYTEAEGKQIGLKMLLVFFNQDRYEGHLWFSSDTLVERTQ